MPIRFLCSTWFPVTMTDYMLDQALSYPHRDHWDRVYWAIVSELHDLG